MFTSYANGELLLCLMFSDVKSCATDIFGGLMISAASAAPLTGSVRRLGISVCCIDSKDCFISFVLYAERLTSCMMVIENKTGTAMLLS